MTTQKVRRLKNKILSVTSLVTTAVLKRKATEIEKKYLIQPIF